jgi:hypothetical protein
VAFTSSSVHKIISRNPYISSFYYRYKIKNLLAGEYGIHIFEPDLRIIWLENWNPVLVVLLLAKIYILQGHR